MMRKFGTAPFIALSLVRMLTPIKLNREFVGRTGEIDNMIPDRMLPPKFPRCEAVAHRVPEDPLGARGLVAQAPRDEYFLSQWVCHAPPHPTSPPQRGREEKIMPFGAIVRAGT